MSASKIQVEPKDVTQAGVDMGAAANTTHEVLGQIAAVTQPITAATLGTPALGAAFDNFWHSFRQQQQLSHDVLAELGKKLGGAAVKINNTDTGNANGMNGIGTNAPSTTTPATTPTAGPPGGDTTPPPVSSAPPPPDSSAPPDSTDPGGDGTASSPGSATPESSTISANADTATAAAFDLTTGV